MPPSKVNILSHSLALCAVSTSALCQTSNVFPVSRYGATGGYVSGTCSGQAGSKTLTGCTFQTPTGFVVGQGIHIYSAGPAVYEKSVTDSDYNRVVIASQLNVGTSATTGTHTYCYVVRVADPFGGITIPSQQTSQSCVHGEPDLSALTTVNTVDVGYGSQGTSGPNGTMSGGPASLGPSATFLWYVSKDNAPYYLFDVVGAGAGNYGASLASAFAIDGGQSVGTRGNWPTPIDVGQQLGTKNEDFFSYVTAVNGNQITMNDAPSQNFTSQYVANDDTLAIQSAINAAAVSGGTVQLSGSTYLIFRPVFVDGTKDITYPSYTLNLKTGRLEAAFPYLYIPAGSQGHVHIVGAGAASTTIYTAPDHGGQSHLLDMGNYARPDGVPLPAYKYGVIAINPVSKGANQVVISNPASAPPLAANDDIWLYSGSYAANSSDSACVNGQRSDGAIMPTVLLNSCHYSELNTISSVSNGVVTLVYPTSKKYYNDGKNSFGMVKMPVIPHDIALENVQINTFNSILSPGLAYNVLVSGVTVNGQMGHGAFGGGYKRGLIIQNSTWAFGSGDAGSDNEDEYDQITDASFLTDNITGYALPGSEASTLQATIRGTEGASHFVVQNTVFNDIGLILDQTSDDIIKNNTFTDSVLFEGVTYAPTGNTCRNPNVQDASFLSYASQASADIESNVFNADANYLPPGLMLVGDFTNSTIQGNTLNYAGSPSVPIITTYAGSVMNNKVAMSGSANNAVAYCLVPDQSPNTANTAFNVQGNSASGLNSDAAIFVPYTGFTDTAPTCIKNNSYNSQTNVNPIVASPGSINLSCPQ